MSTVTGQLNWNRKVDRFIIGLAHEGVPRRAIARALSLPADEIDEVVADAVDRGIIIAASPLDWPRQVAGSREGGDRLPPDSPELVLAATKVFGLSPQLAVVFLVLVRHQSCSRSMLYAAILSSRKSRRKRTATGMKILDVLIGHLRKRLQGRYTILTVYAAGYMLEAADRQDAIARLQDFLNPVQPNPV